MKKALLAPMAELCHRALRELIAGFGGCDEYFTEMLSAGGLLAGGPFEKYYLDVEPEPSKTVYQLVGHDAGCLARAAAFLAQRSPAPLGIDINMGCSAPLILKQGMGAAWLRKPDAALHMLEMVRASIPAPLRLSVKMRLGDTDDYPPLLAFCRGMENAGVDMVTLHARTIKEKFKRRVRAQITCRLARDLSIPVVYNGDISSRAELLEAASDDAPYAAVMLGRLAVKEPWVFSNCRPPQGAELTETALRFLTLLRAYQPREFHRSRALRFFQYYCKNWKWGEYLFNKIRAAADLDTMEKILATETMNLS